MGRNLRTSSALDTTDVNGMQPINGVIKEWIGKRKVEIMNQLDGTIHRRHIHVSPSSKTAQHSSESKKIKSPQKSALSLSAINSPLLIPTETKNDCDTTTTEVLETLQTIRENQASPLILSRLQRNIHSPFRYEE